MKETTLDVLFYLLDNFSDYDDSGQNRDILHDQLEDAGFPATKITQAFDWLESLSDEKKYIITPPREYSTRIFSTSEQHWLNPECQGYLMFLHDSQVLSRDNMEFIIDKVLALKDVDFNLNKLKWVVLMILLNQPDKEAEFAWMDDIAMGGSLPVYH
jgi:Smg protein